MYDKIVDILCAIKEDQPELRHSLSPETDLNNDIGLDSLQMIQFMLKVEDQTERGHRLRPIRLRAS
ncbi:phosphopantetheine-binding protein [Paenibacillus sp. 1P03SA]|uniref:phosphopantetheine-binding protein n=1 Tax=Paenibacillus sp. 1P03SA TaxID=3132294 RepID=UPI0039A31906